VVGGGKLADWLHQRGRVDANLRVALLGALGWLPFGLAYPLAPTGVWTAVLLVPAIFFLSMPFGVAPAAIQRITPNTMRAQATAVYLFVINLIGLGCGATAVALFTEQVFENQQALHRSLLAVGAITHLPAALLLWLGLARYRKSLVRLQAPTQPGP